MFFRQVFDPKLAQYAYIVGCQRTGDAIVIDPQRDIERYVEIAKTEGLTIKAVSETHIHADFLSGAREFAEQYDIDLYLSDEGDADWKYFWAQDSKYNFKPLKNGDVFKIGNIQFEVVHAPGHTPEHICFLVTDHGGGADEPMGIISGDFVFVGDLGRPDLLESAAGVEGAQQVSAEQLYKSVQEFLTLPEYLQVWPGHGAGSACGKALGAVPESTVGYEKRFNVSIQAALGNQAAFVDAILDGQPEPPLYFGRMKRENKMGPRILGALPKPAKLQPEQIGSKAGQDNVVIVDMRLDRSAFMKQHVKESLYAPLNSSFPTVTGSFINPAKTIYLIVEKAPDVTEAVNNLIRIGLDHIAGYILASELGQISDLVTIEEITTSDLTEAHHTANTQVLDVRRLEEFSQGHMPGSINIAHTRLLDRIDELSKDQTYLVHCQSGARAAVATAMLQHNGFKAVYVNGHFAAWAQGNSDKVERSIAA
ncbi:MAG: rhodanese-like domain-containing protein [Rhodothermales bacterium]